MLFRSPVRTDVSPTGALLAAADTPAPALLDGGRPLTQRSARETLPIRCEGSGAPGGLGRLAVRKLITPLSTRVVGYSSQRIAQPWMHQVCRFVILVRGSADGIGRQQHEAQQKPPGRRAGDRKSVV